MAMNKLQPNSSKPKKEKVEVEQFVTSEVKEEIFKDGVIVGAKIAHRATVLNAIIIILVMLVVAFIAIPEWRPYLPEFFKMVDKAIEAILKMIA